MIATVLVGPGKPKLVQIQRPPSSQASQEAEISQSIYEERNSGELVHGQATPIDTRPCTPVRRPLEISAFSPYDTPGQEDTSAQHISLDSCISTTACAGSHVRERCGNISPSSENLVPAPLSFPSRTRTSCSDSSIFSSTLKRLQELADPFGSSSTSTPPSEVSARSRRRLKKSNSSSSSHAQTQKNNHSNCPCQPDSQPWPIDDFPQPTQPPHLPRQHPRQQHLHRRQNSSLDVSPTHRPATLTRLRRLHRLNRVLTSVTQAIDHFPSTLLNLSSPTVLELLPPNVPGQTYVDALQRVFPSASTALLESLAAWILIDLFFEGVRAGSLRPGEPGARSRLASGFRFGSSGVSSLGSGSFFTSRQNTSHSDPELDPHTHYHHHHHPYHYRRRRESNLTYRTRGSNSSAIPDKAQQMLGMNTPDVTSLRLSDQALQKRAESVAVSVAVVGQRLVEAVRGSAGWDEDIWRALRVLVGVIGTGAGGCSTDVITRGSGFRGRDALELPVHGDGDGDGGGGGGGGGGDHGAYMAPERWLQRRDRAQNGHGAANDTEEATHHRVPPPGKDPGDGDDRMGEMDNEDKNNPEVTTQTGGARDRREYRLKHDHGQGQCPGQGKRDSSVSVSFVVSASARASNWV